MLDLMAGASPGRSGVGQPRQREQQVLWPWGRTGWMSLRSPERACMSERALGLGQGANRGGPRNKQI